MIRKNTPAVLAAAAGMILSGAVFAQDTAGQSDQQTQGQGQLQRERGQGQARGQGQDRAQAQGQGRGADMQINQQLQQFAQEPDTAGDKLFVLMAAIDNEFEIKAAEKAQEKSQNEQVKQIAQQMIQDHTKAKQQLQQVAQQLQVQLPEQLPRMKQSTLQVMAALPADQFEKHYMAHLQAQHAKDVTKFNACSQLSQNEQVKQFAQQQLPVLQQHFQHVNQTAQALGLPSGMEAVQAGATIEGSDTTGATGAGTSAPGASTPGATPGATTPGAGSQSE